MESAMKVIISIRQQQGAAMVVGLVMLLVMTLLGVSSMSTSTTELKIANNLQTYNTAFQVAESTIHILVDPQNVTVDWTSTESAPVTLTGVHSATLSNGTVIEADAIVQYQQCQVNPDGEGLRGDGTFNGESDNRKATVHDLTVTGRTLSPGGVEIATKSGILVGKKTLGAGC
jgi:type IV pilus assembly protein PilX